MESDAIAGALASFPALTGEPTIFASDEKHMYATGMLLYILFPTPNGGHGSCSFRLYLQSVREILIVYRLKI